MAVCALDEAGPLADDALLVVLGGDGFLMHTLAALGHPPVAVFGLNFGQVGFLMNRSEHARDLAELLRGGRFVVTELPVIAAEVAGDEGVGEVCALNDFVLERAAGQTVRLDVYIEGVLLNRYSGDGLIVATSTGSTAYSLAAGGPAVHPALCALVVTPVNAHRPVQFHSLQFPLVLPLESRIDITVVGRELRPAWLRADGNSVARPGAVTIRWAGRKVRLLRTEDFRYVRALLQKVIGNDGG